MDIFSKKEGIKYIFFEEEMMKFKLKLIWKSSFHVYLGLSRYIFFGSGLHNNMKIFGIKIVSSFLIDFLIYFIAV